MDDPLKQLHDLHLPVAPAYWPPAPGWWVLAAIVVALVCVGAVYLYRAGQRRRPFRIAERSLDALLASVHTGQLGARAFADSVNALLKRALIHGARRDDSAPLTGDRWLVYLDAIVAEDVFSHGTGAALGDGRFAPDFEPNPHDLHAAARRVLRALARTASR
jgi:hypothetical protein